MAKNSDRDLQTYFEYADLGVEVLDEGLQELPFGEFLIERRALSRAQLLAALLEQDHHPGVPIGEVIAFLGYVPYVDIDRLLTEYHTLPEVEGTR